MPEHDVLPTEIVRERLDELVDWWMNGLATEVGVARRESEIVALSLYGLAAHAHSLAGAIRVLDKTEQTITLVPLVRELLECAVTAMWVESFGKRAAMKILSEDARQRVQAFKSFVDAGAPDDGSEARWQGELEWLKPQTTPASEKLYQRCEEIKGLDGAYAMYRALSGLSHPSGLLIDLYMEATPPTEAQPEGGLRLVVEPEGWTNDAMLGIALNYLLLTSMAWDRIVKGRPARTRLKQVATELGVRLEWTPTAEGLRRHRDWEKEQAAQRDTLRLPQPPLK